MATLKERTETELRESLSRLPAEEAAVLALLQQRMERQMRKDPSHRPHRKKIDADAASRPRARSRSQSRTAG